MEDKQKEAEISDEELFQIFKSYDLDNNGLLDHDEIKKKLWNNLKSKTLSNYIN